MHVYVIEEPTIIVGSIKSNSLDTQHCFKVVVVTISFMPLRHTKCVGCPGRHGYVVEV